MQPFGSSCLTRRVARCRCARVPAKERRAEAFRTMAAATAANAGKVDSKSIGSMMHRFHISSVAPGRTPDKQRLLPVLEHVKQIDMMPSEPGGHIVSPSVTAMLRNEHEHRWGTGCIRPSSTFFTHTNIFHSHQYFSARVPFQLACCALRTLAVPCALSALGLRYNTVNLGDIHHNSNEMTTATHAALRLSLDVRLTDLTHMAGGVSTGAYMYRNQPNQTRPQMRP